MAFFKKSNAPVEAKYNPFIVFDGIKRSNLSGLLEPETREDHEDLLLDDRIGMFFARFIRNEDESLYGDIVLAYRYFCVYTVNGSCIAPSKEEKEECFYCNKACEKYQSVLPKREIVS